MKIRPVDAELFNADGQTDRHDVDIATFRNFAKAPKQPSFCAISGFRRGLISSGMLHSLEW